MSNRSKRVLSTFISVQTLQSKTSFYIEAKENTADKVTVFTKISKLPIKIILPGADNNETK